MNRVILYILPLLLLSCATPQRTAQRTVETAFELVDSVLMYEYNHPNPPKELKDLANFLRETYPPIHWAAVSAIRLWEKNGNKPPELDSLMQTIADYITFVKDYNEPNRNAPNR